MAEEIPGVHSDPDILGGTAVFVGTRVPVRALLDYLEHGRPLAEFLDDFPTVEKGQALGVLEHLKQLAERPRCRTVHDVDDLRPLLPGVEQALTNLRPGEIIRVGG